MQHFLYELSSKRAKGNGRVAYRPRVSAWKHLLLLHARQNPVGAGLGDSSIRKHLTTWSSQTARRTSDLRSNNARYSFDAEYIKELVLFEKYTIITKKSPKTSIIAHTSI